MERGMCGREERGRRCVCGVMGGKGGMRVCM